MVLSSVATARRGVAAAAAADRSRFRVRRAPTTAPHTRTPTRTHPPTPGRSLPHPPTRPRSVPSAHTRPPTHPLVDPFRAARGNSPPLNEPYLPPKRQPPAIQPRVSDNIHRDAFTAVNFAFPRTLTHNDTGATTNAQRYRVTE